MFYDFRAAAADSEVATCSFIRADDCISSLEPASYPYLLHVAAAPTPYRNAKYHNLLEGFLQILDRWGYGQCRDRQCVYVRKARTSAHLAHVWFSRAQKQMVSGRWCLTVPSPGEMVWLTGRHWKSLERGATWTGGRRVTGGSSFTGRHGLWNHRELLHST